MADKDAKLLQVPLAALAVSADHARSRPLLTTRNVAMAFGKTEVLRDINLHVAAGETLVILGDSGCGKTTLLRILAGLLKPSGGDVCLDGRSLAGVLARDRGIIYLDQEAMLFEHLNVFENIAFAMRLQRKKTELVRQAVEQIVAATDLREHVNKRSWQLSGGQKQRVAFARAILARPRVLLLDEPFCSLDGGTRGAMQRLFQQLCQQYGMTSLFVTHDVKEALVVGSRFALMKAGQLRMYDDCAAFIRDEATGIPDEIAFWRRVPQDS